LAGELAVVVEQGCEPGQLGLQHGVGPVLAGHVVAMETLSTIGRWWMYLPVFLAIAGWLLWRRLTRLAVFVAVTVGVSPGGVPEVGPSF
jgi:hypothetical protein